MCEASRGPAALDVISGKERERFHDNVDCTKERSPTNSPNCRKTFRRTVLLRLLKQKITIDLDEYTNPKKMLADEKSLTKNSQKSGSLWESEFKTLRKQPNNALVTSKCVKNYRFLSQTTSTSRSHMSSVISSRYLRIKSKVHEGLKKNMFFCLGSCFILLVSF